MEIKARIRENDLDEVRRYRIRTNPEGQTCVLRQQGFVRRLINKIKIRAGVPTDTKSPLKYSAGFYWSQMCGTVASIKASIGVGSSSLDRPTTEIDWTPTTRSRELSPARPNVRLLATNRDAS